MPDLHLASPPEVVSVGRGVHGIHRLRDLYRLPDLWQLHLYGYSAELTVDGKRLAGMTLNDYNPQRNRPGKAPRPTK